MNLTELSQTIHADNVAKGFWESNRQRPESLMLMVSELSEALEADRKAKEADLRGFKDSPLTFENAFREHIKDTFQDELADCLIRILDLCGREQIDIQTHVELKLQYNRTRPHKHGKKF